NIPFIIRWPEKIAGGGKNNVLLGPTDVMPTLLQMLGATRGIPEDLDGRDLSSVILENKGRKPEAVPYYYIEEGRPASGHRGIRTERYTYVITLDDDQTERRIMFDNEADPFQMNNIAGQDTDAEKRLYHMLMQLLKDRKDPWLEHYNELPINKNDI